MPLALSLAWRLLLAIALIVSPMAAMASGGDCTVGATQVKVATQLVQATTGDMSGCTHMADMATAKAPQGKADPSRTASADDAACSSSACCFGGAVAVTSVALAIAPMPECQAVADFHDAPALTPPAGRMLRPPIA